MKKNLAPVFVMLLSAVSLTAYAAGDIEAGKAAATKYNCAACHGADYNTPIDPSYPLLAGQHQDYLATALVAYKRGADGPNGRGNAIMAAQAKPLNQKEIQDIAAYLHSLPGKLVLKK